MLLLVGGVFSEYLDFLLLIYRFDFDLLGIKLYCMVFIDMCKLFGSFVNCVKV